MAIETWPPTLPKCFGIDGFSYQEVPNVIRSEVEVGAAKVRRRYTRSIVNISAGMVVDSDGVKDFQTFYDFTLHSGVNSFLYQDPVMGKDVEMRFVSPSVITPIGDRWKVAMQIEVLP